jgi:hypothetical protein
MSTSKADRPAFPSTKDTTEWREGISIRDYFAAKVITGAWQNISPGSQSELAKRSYEIADAMLNERQK